jgi:cyclopropane-fatty-acyl-phospholipid synthase
MTAVELPTLPALVPGTVQHQRRGPVDHRLRHGAYQWLVDLEALPDLELPLRAAAGFRSEDHLGDPRRSIRANVLAFARTHGVDLPADTRVVMLANARVLGYVFNPLTVHWCLDRQTGEVRCVVAEVHNTYGERHAYLLRTDARGASVTDKVFYVSPFYDVSGRYRLTFGLSPQRVAVTVTLHRGGDPTSRPDFTASFHGAPEPVTPRRLLRQVLRRPLMSQQVSLLIKAHGVWLWARRLPVQARSPHRPPEGVVMTQSQTAPGSTDDLGEVLPAVPEGGPRAAIARRLFRRAQDQVRGRVLWPDGRLTGGGGPESPVFELVRPEQFFSRVARDLKIGFGEAYMAGDWRPAAGHDLADVLEPWAERLTELVPRPLQRFRRLVDLTAPAHRRNTPEGARTNVEAHYDLSNELFSRFLDPSMTYSAALFAQAGPPFSGDLEEAQHRKIDHILDLAGVGPGTRVLEIGCGWGSLLLRAAQRGATVTSITLSSEQLALVREKVSSAGLSDRVEVRLQDYRDVRGEYDAVVSVEMLEAVGAEFWPTYFQKIDSLLAPGGTAAIQSITMDHDRMLATMRSHSWIVKYIFPGGVLPSLRAVDEVLAEHTRLRVTQDLGFGRHYAETLQRWRTRFDEQWDDIRPHGFDERFRRMWEFYLGYCEAGFRTGYIDVHQLQLRRS